MGSLADTVLIAQGQRGASHDAPSTTSFGRALTKVKLQIQTKRLKEKYLGHEWIRLALRLPVDTSHIDRRPSSLYYYYETTANADGHFRTKVAAVKRAPPPPPATTTTDAASLPCHRTNEIATWYEWKFDRSKFTIDQVETKVDRLRTARSPVLAQRPDCPGE
ncbi:hypothetical protein BC940DRAFT_290573 [Gongronella butleri]|nr:hypothetical protein BC940DRAFT_290573 [Gongronella butleri]